MKITTKRFIAIARGIHLKCYNLNRSSAAAVKDNNNLLFLCDTCLSFSHPSTMVNVCSNLCAVNNEVAALKSAMIDLQSTINSQTSLLPPVALFSDLVASLIVSEIRQSLHTMNVSHEATAKSNLETLDAIRQAQTNIDTKLTATTTSWDDVLKSLADVRTALSHKNTDHSMTPLTFSASNHLREIGHSFTGGKRRLIHENGTDSPKRPKQFTLGTGPADVELETVIPRMVKSMVASRFAPQTDASKVLTYVIKNLSLPDDSNVVTVRSLAPRGRPIAELTFVSFKITVPEEYFDKLMSPEFWPANTTIREFELRASKTANFF